MYKNFAPVNSVLRKILWEIFADLIGAVFFLQILQSLEFTHAFKLEFIDLNRSSEQKQIQDGRKLTAYQLSNLSKSNSFMHNLPHKRAQFLLPHISLDNRN